jgi:O-antigen ligase
MAVITDTRAEPAVAGRQDATAMLQFFLVLLFCLPAQLVVGPLGAAGSPASLFGMLLFVWWAVTRIVTDLRLPQHNSPIRVAFFCYATAAVVSYLAGMLRPSVAEEISSSDRGLLTLIGWAGVCLVTAEGLRSRANLDRLLRGLVAAGVFLALLGIVQYFVGINPVGELTIPGLTYNHPFGGEVVRSGFNRVQGTASHPIEFGVVLVFILPLALHYAWGASEQDRRKRWAQVILIASALPMTVARSAILGAAVVVIALLVAWPQRRRRKVLLVLPVFAVILRLMLPGLLGTIRGLFLNVSTDPSTQGRTEDYAAIVHYFSGAPLFGRGISTFIPSIYRTLDNAYLGWLVEAGLLGIVTLLAMMLVATLCAWRIRSLAVDEETRDLAACLGASLLSAVFTFGTFDAFGFPLCASVYFLLVGATAALWRLTQADRAIRVAAPSRRRPGPYLRPAWRVGLAAAIAFPVLLLPHFATGHVFWAEASIILRSDESPLRNPLVNQAALQTQSELVARVVDSTTTRRQLRAAGATAEYTVALGNGSLVPLTDLNGQGPLMRVRASSADATHALATRDALVKEVQRQVTAMQTAAGAPLNTQFRAEVVAAADEPIYLQGNSKRGLVAALLVALMLARAMFWCLSRIRMSWLPRWTLDRPSPEPPQPPLRIADRTVNVRVMR